MSWFEYSQCLADLVDTGHIDKLENGRYMITEKGDRNCAATESSLPYSVRTKAERLIKPIAAQMKRDALIVTEPVSYTHLPCPPCRAPSVRPVHHARKERQSVPRAYGKEEGPVESEVYLVLGLRRRAVGYDDRKSRGLDALPSIFTRAACVASET